MFSISVETKFQATHYLSMPDGSKEPQHHHTWLVTIDLAREHLDSMGLVMDFNKLKNLTDALLAEFDNTLLNDHDCFKISNPSAENVAAYIFQQIEPRLPAKVILQKVSVVEEPGCTARFSM